MKKKIIAAVSSIGIVTLVIGYFKHRMIKNTINEAQKKIFYISQESMKSTLKDHRIFAAL